MTDVSAKWRGRGYAELTTNHKNDCEKEDRDKLWSKYEEKMMRMTRIFLPNAKEISGETSRLVILMLRDQRWRVSCQNEELKM